MVGKNTRFWTQDNSFGADYTNNRRQYAVYDDEGHITDSINLHYDYDASGRAPSYGDWTSTVGGDGTGHPLQPGYQVDSGYDGSGTAAKQMQIIRSKVLIDTGPQHRLLRKQLPLTTCAAPP